MSRFTEGLRGRLSYANVMATVAVFIALGGSSYAAVTIGSGQIKNNSVQGKDIKNNTIASKDVHNGSLLGKDFKVGQLPAGPQGPPGPTGPQGSRGSTGPAGSSGAPAASLLTGRFQFDYSSDTFASPVGTLTGGESAVQTLSPARSIVARDLAVNESAAVNGDNTRVYTLRVNSASTALTCAVSSGNMTCQDATHAVTIAPGSLLALSATRTHGSGSTSGNTTAQVRFGFRATTP